MPLTSAQLVAQASQIAKVPGFTSQAGQLLNLILSDLCQTYDFNAAMNTGAILTIPASFDGADNDKLFSGASGPYALPADYLRMISDEVIYQIDGTPYVMVNIDLAEFDALVQQAGISNYPENFATDTSLSPKGIYLWPPPSGAYTIQIRYYCQMPDITMPETSATVPWFPNQAYLKTRLAGELMQLADDDRANVFLGEGPNGAQGILNRYLKLQADDEGRAMSVKLDRRHFTTGMSRLPQTKTLGWAFALAVGLVQVLSLCYHPETTGVENEISRGSQISQERLYARVEKET